MNKVALFGHITAAPEIRYLGAQNTPVAEFNLAVNDVYYKGNEKCEEVSFIKIKCFHGWAENAAKMPKGALCLVSGKLKQDRWEDKETKKQRDRTLVHADQVFHVAWGSKREGAEAPPTRQSAPAPAQGAPATDAPPSEDDVPF